MDFTEINKIIDDEVDKRLETEKEKIRQEVTDEFISKLRNNDKRDKVVKGKNLNGFWGKDKGFISKTKVSFKGDIHTIEKWSKITGIFIWTIIERLENLNWSIEKTLTSGKISKFENQRYTVNGERKLVTTFAKRIGITPSAIYYRMKTGWRMDKALTTPSRYQKKSLTR